MVAEPLTEVTPEPITPDPIPAEGNAGIAQPADAVQATPENKEGTSAAPEPVNDAELPADLKALLDEAAEARGKAAEEKAAREATERIERERQEADAREAQQRQQQAFRLNYQRRAKEAFDEAYQDGIDAGLTETQAQEKANKALQRFNSHHADGLQLYEGQASAVATQQQARALNAAIYRTLGKDNAAEFFGTQEAPISHGSIEDGLAALKTIWTKGMVPESDVKAQIAEAKVAQLAQLEKEGRLVSLDSGKAVSGGAVDTRSEDAKLMDPNVPASVKQEILARRGM